MDWGTDILRTYSTFPTWYELARTMSILVPRVFRGYWRKSTIVNPA